MMLFFKGPQSQMPIHLFDDKYGQKHNIIQRENHSSSY